MKIRHPYIFASLFATLLALIVWYFLPKEYSADTMISDETKEVEFEVGISKLEALIRYQKGIANEGINNIETYCEILKSKDFAQKIAER